MSKNEIYSIDELLKMPEMMNTKPLYNDENESISNEAISIDNLLDDNKENFLNKHEDVKTEVFVKKKNVPPPPPIPIQQVKIEKPDIESKKPNIDLFEDIDINQQVNMEFNDEKQYYENIVEEQDIKNDPQYTRIYFDEEIEKQLNELDGTQNNNISDAIVNDNIETPVNFSDIKETTISIDDEKHEQKNKWLQKLRNKTKIFKENLIQVPGFYKFEYRYSKLLMITSSILMLLVITSYALGSYAIFGLNFSKALYFPITLVAIGVISFLIMSIIKFKSLKKELINNGYQLTKENPFTTLTRIYKQLITSNYYLNWGALSTYVVSGLLILLTFIVCYFINLADRNNLSPIFGELVINKINNAPLIVVWSFAAVCFLMLFLQLLYNPLNAYRRNQIEVFYGKTLISEEMIEKYKKSANRKGIAIFIVSTIFVSVIVLLVYFIMKKKGKRTIL